MRVATLLLLLLPAPAIGQNASVRITVEVVSEGTAVSGAQVQSGTAAAVTDGRGRALLALPPGRHVVSAHRIGLRRDSLLVELRVDTTVVLSLEPEALEEEEIIVSSTRTDKRVEDEPIRVEVIGREEIEEKLLMSPGDVAMLLNETSGLRVQPTAPSLGGASVRIQGLLGRYTQVLADGLPLYGGQTGALGPLQIPPMDLGRVEVIKGVTSALYGASALGGVVNLISRRPVADAETEIMINQTSLGGSDAILWRSQPLNEQWSYSLLASGNRQSSADVDSDGWADLPRFDRLLARPRLHWHNGRGGSLLVTLGGMIENRVGGSAVVREAVETRRFDAGGTLRVVTAQGAVIGLRGSAAFQKHDHDFGGARELDDHGTGFFEASIAKTVDDHTLVAGAAVQIDQYDARSIPGLDYTFTVPGIFAQDEWTVSETLTLSASGRLDHHSRYGTTFNPRLSALFRPGAWTFRASLAQGYFAPTPWTDETEALGLSRVTGFSDLSSERATSFSIDVTRSIAAFEFSATIFGSEIRRPVELRAAEGSALELVNAETPIRTFGSELLARYHREGLHVTATHVAMRSRHVPLTPRHSASLVAAMEQEGRGRLGFEFYYTGVQSLDHNPYRETSRPYVIVGVMGERRLGRVRLFLNAENIFDTRQTRYDPLVLPARSREGFWTTPVWAPLEGRSFNGGVRWLIS